MSGHFGAGFRLILNHQDWGDLGGLIVFKNGHNCWLIVDARKSVLPLIMIDWLVWMGWC